MDILKRLFGGMAGSGGDSRGVYFYVRPNGCTEVVRVRVDIQSEPSLSDDETHYFVRKTARGTTYKCTRSAELYFTFDKNHKLKNTEVTDGALVTQADYDAWMASQATPSASS